MLRPLAAGLMCLGFVTLGVAVSGGQDSDPNEKKAPTAVEEKKETPAVDPKTGDEKSEPKQIQLEIKNVDVIARDEKEKPAGRKDPQANPKEKESRIEIQIGKDGTATIIRDGEKKNIKLGGEGGQVIILNEDGKTVEKGKTPKDQVQSQQLDLETAKAKNRQLLGKAELRLKAMQDQVGAPQIDKATRDAIEKLIFGLKEEVARLQAEGKREEADLKLKSVNALGQLLNPTPITKKAMTAEAPQKGGFTFQIGSPQRAPSADELKKLHDQLRELVEKQSQLPEGDKAARASLDRTINNLKKQLERQRQPANPAPGASLLPGAPVPPPGAGQPGIPAIGQRLNPAPANPAPGQPVTPTRPGLVISNLPPGASPYKAAPQGAAVAGQVAGGWAVMSTSPEADALTKKADALMQAAAKLKEAGIADLAHGLHEQAERLQAEAAKLRAKPVTVAGFSPWGAPTGMAGGQPVDLQRSIGELKEQVQQLRKEIAELRELLQQRAK